MFIPITLDDQSELRCPICGTPLDMLLNNTEYINYPKAWNRPFIEENNLEHKLWTGLCATGHVCFIQVSSGDKSDKYVFRKNIMILAQDWYDYVDAKMFLKLNDGTDCLNPIMFNEDELWQTKYRLLSATPKQWQAAHKQTSKQAKTHLTVPVLLPEQAFLPEPITQPQQTKGKVRRLSAFRKARRTKSKTL